jgi:hypothetical protein
VEEPQSPHGGVGLVPGESARMKPGTCLLNPELLTVVAKVRWPMFRNCIRGLITNRHLCYLDYWYQQLRRYGGQDDSNSNLEIVGISPLPSRAGKAEKDTMARGVYAAGSELVP